MQTTKRQLIPLIAATFLLFSCFHKSTTTGTADNIEQSFTCHTAKGDYLVTHESIFQATSKSSGPKGNFTSGYTDYRFTVRDLQTGAQMTRLVTGDRDNDFLLLGFDGKQLWCYSADKKNSLHARDPVSLQIVVTHGQIEAANPSLAGNMNAPKITDADQYFRYDPATNNIMITDLQGNLFLIDPATLKATAIKKKPAYYNSFANAKSTSAYRFTGENISLSGSPRNQINFGHDNLSDDTYLSGSILLDQNTFHLSAIANTLIAKDNNVFKQIQTAHDSLLAVYPVLTDERNAYLTIKDYHLIEHFKKLDEKVKERASDSGYAYENIIRHLNDMVLAQDTNTLYLLHAKDLTDTAGILISKINIAGNKAATLWTTVVPQIYFDPSKAIKKGGMSGVFKSGNPDFDYESYSIEGNVLTGIKMLFGFGIDTNTGKLLWKEQL